MKLAEGSIGDVDALPEGLQPEVHLPVRLSLIEDFAASTSFGKAPDQQQLLQANGKAQVRAGIRTRCALLAVEHI